MYKLITIDLDGTLLNSYGEISKKDVETLDNVMNKGIKVVLTSGRTNTAMESFALRLGATEYMITGNGATIWDFKKNENIYNKYLPKEKVLQIAQIAEENSIYYNVYTENSIITKGLNYNTLFYYHENLRKQEKNRTNINIVESITQYIQQMNTQKFLKITVCDDEKNIFNGIMNKLKQIKNVDILEVAHMSRKIINYGTEEKQIQYYYTEITNENVNKWSAIDFLIQKLDIKPSEVISIGDNVNDIEMIKKSGLGIAMGNSCPEVKQIADFVTLDNNSDGVAYALEQNILL